MKVPAYIVWVVAQVLLAYIGNNLKEWYRHLFQIQHHGTGDEIGAMPMLLTMNMSIYQTNNEAQKTHQGIDRGMWLPVVGVSNNQSQYTAILIPLKISSSTSALTNLKTADATTDLDVFVSVSNGGTGYNGKKCNCDCPKPDPCDDETEERLRRHLGFNIICGCLLFLVYIALIAVSYLHFRSEILLVKAT